MMTTLRATKPSPAFPFTTTSAPGFERQTLAYLNSYFQARSEWPNLIRAMGHNHFTLAFHIGSTDDSLAGQMLGFIRRVLNEKSP